MNPHDPILIASPTRCGTTMLAWLLHLHGVWIGEAGVTKDPTSNPQVPTENIHLKKYLKSIGGSQSPYFKDDILKMVETDGRWLVKTAMNIVCRASWIEHFPNSKWLLPTRPFEDIMASRKRKGVQQREEKIRDQVRDQAKIPDEVKHALFIDMNRLCLGGDDGEEEARLVFGFVEIDFDPGIYHGWVQPVRWHG